MAIDLNKLENLKRSGEKTIAQCPACAETGGDEKGEHLVIWPGGKFGCVVFPGEQGHDHRRRIRQLAGEKWEGGTIRIAVNPAKRPKIQPTGRFGRVFQTLAHTGKTEHGNSDPVHVRTLKRASDPSGHAGQPAVPKEIPNTPSEASEPAPKAPAGLPFLPNIKPLIKSLENTDPNFQEPRNGSLVLGLYRGDDHSVTPVLLWASTETDLFWDVVARSYVHPPRFYLPICDTCPFDPYTGHAIVNGAICPF